MNKILNVFSNWYIAMITSAMLLFFAVLIFYKFSEYQVAILSSIFLSGLSFIIGFKSLKRL